MNVLDRPLEAPLANMADWRLEWVPMVARPLIGHAGPRHNIEVPYRLCPHGGFFFDEKIASPQLRNAWIMLDGFPSCPSGPNGRCARSYRENNR